MENEQVISSAGTIVEDGYWDYCEILVETRESEYTKLRIAVVSGNDGKKLIEVRRFGVKYTKGGIVISPLVFKEIMDLLNMKIPNDILKRVMDESNNGGT